MDTITQSGYTPQAGMPIGTIGKQMINLLPRNPMDVTTIVSIYPRDIIDEKPTMFPARYVIKAAPIGGFSLTHIKGASFFIPSSIERQPPTEVQVNSMALTESILRDSIPTMNLVTAGHRPGIFAIPGNHDKITVNLYKHADGRTFKELLEMANEWQQAYWADVMNEADSFWASTNGNPKSIPEDARLAAKILGMEKSKPWMNNVIASEMSNCRACGEMINPAFPVCKHCHAILDVKKAEELGIQFAAR